MKPYQCSRRPQTAIFRVKSENTRHLLGKRVMNLVVNRLAGNGFPVFMAL